jgi:hypothetical protein
MANPALSTDFKIATYAAGTGGLVTLKSLGIPNPHPIWKPGVQSIKLGDNSARTLGSPVVEWHWGFLQQAQRDMLRTYCTGASASVYIVTTTTENVSSVPNVSKTYLAQMIWPAPNTPEDPQTGRRLEFMILFRQLVVQP